MVINDQGYASADAAEDAVAARNTTVGNEDVIIVFLNQSTGVAEAFFDDDSNRVMPRASARRSPLKMPRASSLAMFGAFLGDLT